MTKRNSTFNKYSIASANSSTSTRKKDMSSIKEKIEQIKSMRNWLQNWKKKGMNVKCILEI